MDYFTELTNLSKENHLVPAEEIIGSKLLGFESFFKSKATSISNESIEEVLLNFYKVNNGTISIQCGIQIANCLITIYKSTNPPIIGKLIGFVSSFQSETILFSVAQVVRIIGPHIHSSIQGIFSLFLKYYSQYPVSCLYGLSECLKRNINDISLSNCKKAFECAKKAISQNSRSKFLFSLKLLRKLLKLPETAIPTKKFISTLGGIFKLTNSAFIIDSTCFTLAKCAYRMILNSNITTKSKTQKGKTSIIEDNEVQSDENHVDSKKPVLKITNEALGILTFNKNYFSSTLQHFIDILDPASVNANLEVLFNFTRNECIDELYQIISFFGPEARISLFNKVAKEKPSYTVLYLLRMIETDPNTIQEIAAIALQLCNSQNEKDLIHGSTFFSFFATVDPEHAKQYLQTSLLFLASPPEDNPCSETDVRGFASIASYILSSFLDNDYINIAASYNGFAFSITNSMNSITQFQDQFNQSDFVNEFADDINKFLERALRPLDKINSYEFIGAFQLLAVVPDYIIIPSVKKQIFRSIEWFSSHFSSSDNYLQISDKDINFLRDIIAFISLYLMNHLSLFTNNESTEIAISFFSSIVSHAIFRERTFIISALISTPSLIPGSPTLRKIGGVFLDIIASLQPSHQQLQNFIKFPLSTGSDLINLYRFNIPRAESFYHKLSSDSFIYYSLVKFPTFFAALSNDDRTFILHKLIDSFNSTVYKLLLHSLIKNKETNILLPPSLFDSLLEVFKNHFNEIIVCFSDLQEFCEILGLWCKSYPMEISRVISFFKSFPNEYKYSIYILYTALFSHCQLDLGLIFEMMHDLNEYVLLNFNDTSHFSLHALSVLYNTKSAELAELGVINTQVRLMLQILNSECIFMPLTLFELSECITNLIPIVTDTDTIKLVVQALNHVPSPYSKNIFFNALSSVIALAKNLISPDTIKFPTYDGASLSLQLSSCKMLTDILKTYKDLPDYFDLVPKLLVLLQRTNDIRALNIINQIAINDCDKYDQTILSHDEIAINKSKARILEWVNLIKAVLSSDTLPNAASMQPSTTVKTCLLIVCRLILPKLHNKNSEALDDIMTSVTRALELNRLRCTELAYSIFTDVINQYRDTIVNENDHLLSLYSAQFSMAVKLGFRKNLKFSVRFLSEYLRYLIQYEPDNILNILSYFVHGLKGVEKYSPSYILCVAELCFAAYSSYSTYPKIFDMIKPLCPQFLGHLSEIINISHALWISQPLEWNSIASFRVLFSETYSKILQSVIFLQSKKEELKLSYVFIDIEELVKFSIDELNNTHEKVEQWRVDAAFYSILAALQSTNTISQSTIDSAISEIKKHSEQYKEQIPTLLLAITQRTSSPSNFPENSVKDNHQWEELMEIVLNEFNLAIMANLLKKSTNVSIAPFTHRISSAILSSKVEISQMKHLFTLLRSKSTEDFGADIVASSLRPIDRLAILKATHSFSSEAVQFCWQMFKSGGMAYLGSLLSQSVDLNFTQDQLELLKRLILSEEENAPAYLQFLRLAIEKSKIDTDFAADVAIDSLVKWQNEATVMAAAFTIKDIENKHEDAVKKAFQKTGQRNQQFITQILENISQKRMQRSKGKELKPFSTTIVRRQTNESGGDGEWQDLDESDD